LFGGAIGKSAQFPLNEWLLEAMTGPTAVSALIHAATMVKAGVFLVARIGPLFFALAMMGAFSVQQFFEVVAWVGAITAFLLATQALVNPEIKKVLAYSTGSQIGYMMMGLGIAGLSLNFVDGYTSGFFHMMSHAMFKASLFMGAGALLHSVGSRFMTDMGGLKKPMRKTYIFMLLASLSLAGAPLFTSGFWSKDAIFASVLESGYAYTWPLFIMAVDGVLHLQDDRDGLLWQGQQAYRGDGESRAPRARSGPKHAIAIRDPCSCINRDRRCRLYV
jgi:NADH-quinone oxidoreductase subunit L